MPLRDITLPSIHHLAITRHHVTSPLANAKIGGRFFCKLDILIVKSDRPGGLIMLPSKKTPSFVTPPVSSYMCKAKSYVYVGGQYVQISTKSYVLKLTQELCASYCVRAITLQNKTLNPQPSTLNVSKLSIPQNNGIVLGIICKSTLLL